MNSFDINLPSYLGFDFDGAAPLLCSYENHHGNSNDYSEVNI